MGLDIDKIAIEEAPLIGMDRATAISYAHRIVQRIQWETVAPGVFWNKQMSVSFPPATPSAEPYQWVTKETGNGGIETFPLYRHPAPAHPASEKKGEGK